MVNNCRVVAHLFTCSLVPGVCRIAGCDVPNCIAIAFRYLADGYVAINLRVYSSQYPCVTFLYIVLLRSAVGMTHDLRSDL